MAQCKFFRVATEGATCDGRKIERSWIEDMVEGYNRHTYGARIFLEHMRGVVPDSPFKAYGDVLSLKAEDAEDGRLALFAQIDPTPDLVALSKARQKVYTSIEIDPDFAGSGKAYMVGLAITDSPASLGTEMLQFCASLKERSPLAARKLSPQNLFSESAPVSLIFGDEGDGEKTSSIFARVRELLNRRGKSDDVRFADIGNALEALAENAGDTVRRNSEAIAQVEARIAHVSAQVDDLVAKLSVAPASTPDRPVATGGNVSVETDC